jgi:solute carrier family 25 phosphate transporter 23/24/25/41
MPVYLLKFPLNEFYRKSLGIDPNAKKKPFGKLLGAGVLAGLTQISITYPLDIMRTRMSLDYNMTKNYNGYFKCASDILRNEGIGAFYKGFPITGLSYPFYVGIQFSIYESIRADHPYLAGATAGIIAQSLMYPGDTIKRQLQLNGIENTKKKFSSIPDCIRHMYRTHGIRGFYPGYGINLIKAVPEATIQFAAYEYFRSLFSR